MNKPTAADVTDALVVLIADDLEKSIAGLGYPVGMGVAPNLKACALAARQIVERISDKALALLAERKAP